VTHTNDVRQSPATLAPLFMYKHEMGINIPEQFYVVLAIQVELHYLKATAFLKKLCGRVVRRVLKFIN